MSENTKKLDMPTTDQLQKEVDRVHYRRDFSRVMVNTIYSLVVVAAVAVLVAVLLLPILRIYGHSMNDTLDEGDIVVSLKGSDFKTGDIIAFYYNNKILIKRVIGKAGDWVDIDQDGNVYVNGNLIDEPYLDEKAFGECNIELPYQVPESKVFVMGDNRSVSVDSRNTAVGCVAEEQIVGKVVYRLWPLKDFGNPAQIQYASFVSLFVKTAVVKKLGLPYKEFFIWSDDFEYTRRISKRMKCYYVPSSVVYHFSKANVGADIVSADADNLGRFEYLYRNDVVLYRQDGFDGAVYLLIRDAVHIVRILLRSENKKIKIALLLRNLLNGIKFKPNIDYPEKV